MAKRPGDIIDWRKDWDWADKDDGPASWNDEDIYEMDIDQLMLPKDAKGIKSIDVKYAKAGGRIGYALGPDDPGGVIQDDLTTTEFMQDQGIPYGEQASGINKDVFIEKVVEEFIKRKGRKPRSIEEIKEFYFQEMAGGAGGAQKVAYEPGNYDPIMVDEYEKYKYDMQEQKPGFPVMEIDEFIEMQRAPVAGGGLPGVLGV